MKKLDLVKEALKTQNPADTLFELYFSNKIKPYAHKNIVTGKYYTGMNIYRLEIEFVLKGYQKPEWATLPQFRSKETSIKKGEKSSEIIVAIYSKAKKSDDEEEKEVLNFYKNGYVFNVEQTTTEKTTNKRPAQIYKNGKLVEWKSKYEVVA